MGSAGAGFCDYALCVSDVSAEQHQRTQVSGIPAEVRKTFVIPAISAVGMGVFCYVFYQGLYFILDGIFGIVLPARVLVFVCLMVSIVFAVAVYFATADKASRCVRKRASEFPERICACPLRQEVPADVMKREKARFYFIEKMFLYL